MSSVSSNVAESLGGGLATEAAAEIAWLAEGEIPKAAVTLLSGEPGSGKSFVACTLAAKVSQVSDARVMFAHSEPAERLYSRLVRAGADAGHITLLAGGDRGQGIGDSKGFAQRLDVLIAWLAGRLDAPIASCGSAFAESRAIDPSRPIASSPCRPVDPPRALGLAAKPTVLIVIDDLEKWCGKALSAAELAEAAARLNELARTSGAAVLAVVRSATTTEGRVTARALDRLMRAAEVVWMVAADREMTGHRWLLPLKNNLAALPKGKTFQIVEGRVEWLNKAVPDDVLAPGSRRSLERADRQTAGQWLFEVLRDQDVPSRMLYAQARQCGFSRNTILRAAHRMGLHSHKCAFDGGWKYSLRDVPSEIIEIYRTHPKWFAARGSAEGFRVQAGVGGQARVGGQRSEVREGFGIQDSAFSMPEAPSGVENAAKCSKNPNDPNAMARGSDKLPKTAENVEESQEYQSARIVNHYSRAPSPQSPALVPSPEPLAPSPSVPRIYRLACRRNRSCATIWAARRRNPSSNGNDGITNGTARSAIITPTIAFRPDSSALAGVADIEITVIV